MADREIEHRLTSTVSGLRRGIASTRGLHASLRSEAKALKDFIPMLVEGARSGITSLLKHQASPAQLLHGMSDAHSHFSLHVLAKWSGLPGAHSAAMGGKGGWGAMACTEFQNCCK